MSDDLWQEQNAETMIDWQTELDETVRALREVTLMIEQSQSEVAKLTQRSAAVTAHLQQALGQVHAMSTEELRMICDSALDAQQRLLVMRGQLEKLQSDRAHLERLKALLERFQAQQSRPAESSLAPASKGPLATVEMLVNAQEAERQRLSRQMHDGPAQALSNFILQTEIAVRLMDIDTAQAREELNNLKLAALNTFQKIRNFIFDLRPMMLDDLGLVPTVRKYADAFREQTGLEVHLIVSGVERRLEPYLEVMIFRAIQELLGNAARHSQATAIKVNLDMGDSMVRVSVDDNGKGMDTGVLERSGGLGLKLIRERAEMLGGTFEVDSTLGKGTRVTFTVPARGPR